ncbi:hypothetical protein WJX74_004169 [Apatococcus lobatus]|uniref:Trafficking protein particle complex subunit 2 n=1 Tax=Apatococcus lobatus TaxID=904363 RepID=A0AAW1S3Z7_9CHLO
MAAGSVLTFVIVGRDDHPIFEADLTSKASEVVNRDDRAQYLHQFVLHAALDAVDEQIWTTTNMHLAQVDNFNQLRVSAYVTAAQMKFLLLHDGKSEDAIKAFFKDVYEVYLKVMMNPFFTPNTQITSPSVHQRIRAIAKTQLKA